MNRITLSFVLLFLLACNKTESIDESNYTTPKSDFNINISSIALTKGALVKTPADMGSIGVYCAYTDNYAWDKGTEFSKLKNQRFDISKEGECTIDGDPVEWGFDSIDDMYTIFAYSPHSSNEELGITPSINNGELVLHYLVPQNSANQPDLMFAMPQKNISPQVSGSVALSFYHLLASVSFGVESVEDIKITDIEVAGAKDEGTITWVDTTTTPKWEPIGSADGIFTVKMKNYTLDEQNSAQLNSKQGYMMMIPQTLDNGAKVTISLSDKTQRELTIPAGTEWVAGCKYHYIIKLDGAECFIRFNSTQLSNCYIINPVAGKSTIIQIPIEDRINTFWEEYSGKGSTKITSNSNPDNFEVALVWEDFNTAADFQAKAIRDSLDGNKMAALITMSAENQEGNFVFSVANKKGDILWSWHLWFTDYNPDEIARYSLDRIVNDVDTAYTHPAYNGAVHRYKDHANAVDSARVWAGIYRDKFIMDRNIGERTIPSEKYGAGAVYYQFGRKDPFPGDCARFRDTITVMPSRSMGSTYYYETIDFSIYFLYDGTSTHNWCGEPSSLLERNIWYDEYIPEADYYTDCSLTKSIFDPSPLGWRVPVSDTWSYFDETGTTQTDCSVKKSVGIYPKRGRREPGNKGKLTQGGNVAYIWSANQDAETGYGRSLYDSDIYIYAPCKRYLSCGFPVRAIQE